MPICTNCKQWYELPGTTGGCHHCEPAGAASAAAEAPMMEMHNDLTPLARFRNWAEAGFFEDLLHREGIAGHLEPREQFDAVAGHWRHQLTLLVPAEQFDRARFLMESELDDTSGTGVAPLEPSVGETSPDSRAAVGHAGRDRFDDGPPLWKPLAVVLVAGGLAYLGSRGLQRAQPRAVDAGRGAAGELSELWEYLQHTGGVWAQPAAPDGRAGHRMWYDRLSDTLHVEQDRDGDGQFERKLRFKRGGKLEEQPVGARQE